ncbi:MAG: hypothetical protein PWR01_4604 [Clostridiales bacterium]|jgi:hypothetical protein|nr:hypothetical protein [Clostridiales bacterium]MDN5283531.1 hypothetical protein [Candidatus Ozemobacter sp.]
MPENKLDKIRKLIFQKDYDQARKLIATFHPEIEPDIDELELAARLHGQTGEIQKALAMFEELETAWPKRSEIFKLHVQFLQECGQIDEALRISLRLLENFGDDYEAYVCAADCNELAGRPAEAMKICELGLQKFADKTRLAEIRARLAPVCKKIETAKTELEMAQEDIKIYQAYIGHDKKFIEKFLEFFRGREGVHARQTEFKKGKFGYLPAYEDLNEYHVRKHLAGDATLGIYLVRKNNTCTLMTIDIDINKPFLDEFKSSSKTRKRLRKELFNTTRKILNTGSEIGVKFLVEFSGFKGLHLWLISDFELPSRYWRQLGKWFTEQIDRLPREIHLEIFPKQDKVNENGLGNLVKLPLGVHKASNQRSLFLDERNFRPFQIQSEAFDSYSPISQSEFEEILGRITLRTGTPWPEESSKPKARSDSIKSEKNNETPFTLKVKIPLPDRFAPEVEQILAWCKPICEVFTEAIKIGKIESTSRHVFIYIFSALGETGKIFLHQIMNQLPDYDPDRLNAEIRAVPPTTMSCGKVRKILKEIVARVGCNCQFRLPEGCYASPVVHAGIFPGAGKTIVNPINQPVAISTRELIAGSSAAIDKLMREYGRLSEEIARAQQRLKILHRQINQIFDENGSNEIQTAIGTYSRLPELPVIEGEKKVE